MKPTFETIHPDIKTVLIDNGIEEKDIFNNYSDLYIGCENREQAIKIKKSGAWRSMSSLFKANKGSDMENYSICLVIDLGYTGYFVNQCIK